MAASDMRSRTYHKWAVIVLDMSDVELSPFGFSPMVDDVIIIPSMRLWEILKIDKRALLQCKWTLIHNLAIDSGQITVGYKRNKYITSVLFYKYLFDVRDEVCVGLHRKDLIPVLLFMFLCSANEQTKCKSNIGGTRRTKTKYIIIYIVLLAGNWVVLKSILVCAKKTQKHKERTKNLIFYLS